MKPIIAVILLSLISFQLDARKDTSLNDAVKHAKTEGRVISARTINNKHEIKVLTPSGTVKTLNVNASSSSKTNKSSVKNQYNRAGQSMRYRKNHPLIPDRLQNNTKEQRRTIKLDNRQIGQEPLKGSRSSTSNRSKNKDK